MHHGGPYPATTAPGHTSVGMTAIAPLPAPGRLAERAGATLPAELQDANPRGIWRRVDGRLTDGPVRGATG